LYFSINYYDVGKLTPLLDNPEEVRGILKLPLPRLFFIAVLVADAELEVDVACLGASCLVVLLAILGGA
jgi:hypothetical protein